MASFLNALVTINYSGDQSILKIVKVSEDNSKYCSSPQLMLVVKCPSGSTLMYSPSMHMMLLEGWDLSISMVL